MITFNLHLIIKDLQQLVVNFANQSITWCPHRPEKIGEKVVTAVVVVGFVSSGAWKAGKIIT